MATNFTGNIGNGGEFEPEANRYLLYVALGCPFAHRALIARKLKGLEDTIEVVVTDPVLGNDGWSFTTPEECPGTTPDPVKNSKLLRELYFLTDPNFAGRITVPVLFDKKTNKIVNNESAEIIRIFNSQLNKFAKYPEVDLYPANLAAKIDALNQKLQEGIITAVYIAGFATSQEGYEKGARLTYSSLLELEDLLSKQEGGFLIGDRPTDADVRLFPTLIRFDPVYVVAYKCNLIRVQDLPFTSAWLKRFLDIKGVRETVNMTHIKKLYFVSARYESTNPYKIIPLYNGPLFPSD
jgi:putative glutathione S-transferase